jgi:hypothetical protein
MSKARVLRWLFATGLLGLLVGGYVASISEWHGGKPRDEKDTIGTKQTAILLILSGGGICICSAVGLYIADDSRRRQSP